MKKWIMPARIAALACAVLLIGGYVYVRAGGRLWPASNGATKSDKPGTPDTPVKQLFYGSKSAPISLPADAPPANSAVDATPPPDQPQLPRSVIMSGSKSAAVFAPNAAPPGSNSETPPAARPHGGGFGGPTGPTGAGGIGPAGNSANQPQQGQSQRAKSERPQP